jgi:hypothetical protein
MNGGLCSTALGYRLSSDKVSLSGKFSDQETEYLLKDEPDLVREGVVQQAIQLLPYIPNILVKLGPRGILSIRLSPKGISPEKGTLQLLGVSSTLSIRHHPGLPHNDIVSVTGAGYPRRNRNNETGTLSPASSCPVSRQGTLSPQQSTKPKNPPS